MAPTTTKIYTLSLHDALPIYMNTRLREAFGRPAAPPDPEEEPVGDFGVGQGRSEEHTSELQSRRDLVCRLLLEKKNSSEVRRARRRKSSNRDSARTSARSALT